MKNTTRIEREGERLGRLIDATEIAGLYEIARARGARAAQGGPEAYLHSYLGLADRVATELAVYDEDDERAAETA